MSPGVVVITGAGSGIGEATALLLARRGASLGLLDVDEDAVECAAELARQAGAAEVLPVSCDVSSEANVAAGFQAIEESLGVPRGLFANAGVDRGGMTHELTLEQWERLLAVNLTGVFLSCREMIRSLLRKQLGGAIVCTSSPAATVALPAAAAYSASKGGISALVRCLALDYAAYGIRVNAVVPGPTDTPLMWANVPPGQHDLYAGRIASEVPLRRVGTPYEVARAVAWLLSDEAAYVTGSHLYCDGGVSAKASVSF